MRLRRTVTLGIAIPVAIAALLLARVHARALQQDQSAKKFSQVPTIEEYQPKSTLVTKEHKVERAKFPFIDIHSHHWNPTAEEVDRLVREMDTINLRVMVNLSGGTGEQLRQTVATMKGRHPDRFVVFANLSYYDASWHALVFNRTLAGFAIFIVALWLIVRTYARSGEAFEEAPIVRKIATVAANVLAIVALSAQAAGYYEARIAEELRHAGTAAGWIGFEPPRNLELAKQLSLSVVWALYASGLFVAARVRRLRLLRVMGLVLLSLTTLKVFLVDLSSLERVYRIISFIMLGAILLIVSYFYTRSQQRVEEMYSTTGDRDGV